MKQLDPAVLPGAWAEPAPTRPAPWAAPLAFINKSLTIAEWEFRKLRHDPSDLVLRSIQPLLWLVIFGETFARIRAIPTGQQNYLQFLAPGVLAQSILFMSIFFGIAVIWERDLGVLHKYLASPTPRAALVLGKAMSAGVRAVPQMVIIYAVSVLLGVHVRWNPLDILGALLMVLLGAGAFATFSTVIACLLRTRDRVMGIGQVITMPLFFASNAIYQIQNMPPPLQVLARVNPLSYMVDALRALMVTDGVSLNGLALDYVVMAAFLTVLILLGAHLYPKVIQ